MGIMAVVSDCAAGAFTEMFNDCRLVQSLDKGKVAIGDEVFDIVSLPTLVWERVACVINVDGYSVADVGEPARGPERTFLPRSYTSESPDKWKAHFGAWPGVTSSRT